MSAVRKASEANARRVTTDTDSDEDVKVAPKALTPLLPISEQPAPAQPSSLHDELTTVIVFGADGNLAYKKTFPALFNLMYKELLADDVVVIGYARAPRTSAAFREMVYKSIYAPTVPNPPRTHFLSQVTYESGQFNELPSFVALRGAIEAREAQQLAEWQQRADAADAAACADGAPAAARAPPCRVRLYYMAVPSFLYYDVCLMLHESGIASDKKVDRFVLEKPFGRDSATCNELLAQLARVLSEDVSYRIDHYLGMRLVLRSWRGRSGGRGVKGLGFWAWAWAAVWGRAPLAARRPAS